MKKGYILCLIVMMAIVSGCYSGKQQNKKAGMWIIDNVCWGDSLDSLLKKGVVAREEREFYSTYDIIYNVTKGVHGYKTRQFENYAYGFSSEPSDSEYSELIINDGIVVGMTIKATYHDIDFPEEVEKIKALKEYLEKVLTDKYGKPVTNTYTNKVWEVNGIKYRVAYSTAGIGKSIAFPNITHDECHYTLLYEVRTEH